MRGILPLLLRGKAHATANAGKRDKDGWSIPETGLDKPKHGKEDAKNEPHVGGNTWAGGTGGSDTAGLGGRGGPYRLDKGHRVHQVSDAAKEAVSDEARAQAAAAAKEGLDRRLEEIEMGTGSFEIYLKYRARVGREIDQLKSIMDELDRRSRERMWIKRQTTGELDDTRLVDGLAGDKTVFKRRGDPTSQSLTSTTSNTDPHKKRLHFVVDVSGSMYRFNGQDRRLERLLEAVLLVLESMPSDGVGRLPPRPPPWSTLLPVIVETHLTLRFLTGMTQSLPTRPRGIKYSSRWSPTASSALAVITRAQL